MQQRIQRTADSPGLEATLWLRGDRKKPKKLLNTRLRQWIAWQIHDTLGAWSIATQFIAGAWEKSQEGCSRGRRPRSCGFDTVHLFVANSAWMLLHLWHTTLRIRFKSCQTVARLFVRTSTAWVGDAEAGGIGGIGHSLHACMLFASYQDSKHLLQEQLMSVMPLVKEAKGPKLTRVDPK